MALQLTHEADGLPAIPEEHSATTIVGAAHYWAGRAKRAERARFRWRVFCAVVLLPYLPLGWMWLLG